MPLIDQGLREIFGDERRAALPPDALLRTVTARAARRRAGTITGASLGALAIMGLAASAALSLGNDAAPAVPPETVLGTVTLPFDSTNAPVGGLAPLGLACGDPAPAPVTRADGIEWDVAEPPGALFSGAGVTTTLRTKGGDTVPASVSLLGFVIVRDGVVAGWTYNSEIPDLNEYRYLDSLSLDHLRGTISPTDETCASQGANGDLAPGNYELYPVVHVTASPEIAARQWLRLQGYSVPLDNATELSLFAPGSWDCATFPTPSGPGASILPDFARPSALCAPPTLEGVTVDRDAKTITMPYTARLYTRSLNITLVGEPLLYTAPPIDTSVPLPPEPFDESPVVPVSDTSHLVCGAHVDAGANYATGRTSVGVEQAAIAPSAATRFENGSAPDLALLPRVLSPTEMVAYPDPLRVWFLSEAPTPANGLIKMRGPGYTVIGSATAVVNAGEPVPLHRTVGPSTTTVTFSEVQWCADSGPDEATVVAFEGFERVDYGEGAWTGSAIFDFWGAGIYDWTGLYTYIAE